MLEKKLSIENLLDALGKTDDSEEMQKLFRILGEADDLEDSNEEGTFYKEKRYSYVDSMYGNFALVWRKYGIDLTFINNNYVGSSPKSYDLSETPELESIILAIKPDAQEGYDSCLGICEDSFFQEGICIDDIVQRFGKTKNVDFVESKNITRYTYYSPKGFKGVSMQFLFYLDTQELFELIIILEEK